VHVPPCYFRVTSGVAVTVKKNVYGLTFVLLLLFSAVAGAMFVNFVSAQSDFKEITIMADGSLSPSNVPIQRNGNVYTLTADIFGQITIKRDGVTIDGAGHALTGYGSENILVAHYGIMVGNSDFGDQSYVTLKNIEVRGFEEGIQVYASNSAIYNCNITDCTTHSISALWLRGSNNTIYGNRIIGNHGKGIIIESGIGIVLCDNIIADNTDYGIEFMQSEVTMKNNILDNNCEAFLHIGQRYNSQDMDASNIVDGKPVCFWINQHDRIVPSNSGYVLLINCTRITVQGLSIIGENTSSSRKYNSNGIHLTNTINSIIVNNNLTVGTGIRVYGEETKNITISQNNIARTIGVFGCNVIGNFITNSGIIIDNSTVTANLIDSCERGITIRKRSNNHIFRNNITNCNVGIFILGSRNNTIHQNNFISNIQPVFEEHYSEEPYDQLFHTYYASVNNTWDGNYWSDYNGIDRDGNGIGDTPYVIFENITDHYPLMHIVDISYATPTPTPSPSPEPEPFPTALAVGASGASIAIIGVGLLVYFRKRGRGHNK
jgi:parallel beta-helix repeat protein